MRGARKKTPGRARKARVWAAARPAAARPPGFRLISKAARPSGVPGALPVGH